jgi:hypothetical protein
MRLKHAVAIFVILFGVSAAARVTNTRKFYLHFPSSVSGVPIPAGIYDLSWTTQGSDVDVTFSEDGHFVASVRGMWVKHGSKYPNDAALLQLNPDGSHSLVEIRLAGIKQTIIFPEPTLRVGTNQASNKSGL